MHESFEDVGSDAAGAFFLLVGKRLSCLRGIPELASVTLDVFSEMGAVFGRTRREVSPVHGVHMFESDESVIQALIMDSQDFKVLYKRHNELKSRVSKADFGTLALGDTTLRSMKREKLLIKDQMAAMIDDYRRKHAS